VSLLERIREWIHPYRAPEHVDGAHERVLAEARRRQRETERRVEMIEARVRSLRGQR
jgi:hypothetical protein